MKRIALYCLFLILCACGSVQKHNAKMEATLPVERLCKDVDYAYFKIRQYHPDLYWYIGKQQLDTKFDSLKKSITSPLTPFAFYTKLAPVVASIRQGHLIVSPPVRAYSKAESKALAAKGTGPFSQFEYAYIGERLYVTRNKSYDRSMAAGSEIISINEVPVSEIMDEYARCFASDGFNETWKKSRLQKNFPLFFTYKNGLQDSIRFTYRKADSIKRVCIGRKPAESANAIEADWPKQKDPQAKAMARAQRKSDKLHGYNPETKLNNRELSFIRSDSSVALLELRSFSIGNYRAFYRAAFGRIKKNNTKTLILDLRDNPGGRLSEINNLYSYLADSTYVFVEPSEVVSKGSLLHGDYFKGATPVGFAQRLLLAPVYYPYSYFRVHRKDDGKYYVNSDSQPQKVQPEAFKGKVYVLINGGSFSASCILSSALKGSKRAYFVGEETGGAYNGTVAGQMQEVALPNSGIKIKIGLMRIASTYHTDQEGRGIFPDREIAPSLEDRIAGKDPELVWILNYLKKHNTTTDATSTN